MGKVFDAIDDHLREWIARQPMFFVGTAPLAGDGHVNVSPKGPAGTFRVLGPRRVAYLDVVGSGAETIAHVRENGRIVVMFCAFDGPPRILRLHGRGAVVPVDDPMLDGVQFDTDALPEARRSVIVVDVVRIADSCGYGVPLMAHEGQRPHQARWAEKKLRTGGSDAIERYKAEKNTVSLDGLPAVEFSPSVRDERLRAGNTPDTLRDRS
jgi:predicted pyridoxine 5'-phosphate oxidase superfamily flavin-nucleotide-binding protein